MKNKVSGEGRVWSSVVTNEHTGYAQTPLHYDSSQTSEASQVSMWVTLSSLIYKGLVPKDLDARLHLSAQIFFFFTLICPCQPRHSTPCPAETKKSGQHHQLNKIRSCLQPHRPHENLTGAIFFALRNLPLCLEKSGFFPDLCMLPLQNLCTFCSSVWNMLSLHICMIGSLSSLQSLFRCYLFSEGFCISQDAT